MRRAALAAVRLANGFCPVFARAVAAGGGGGRSAPAQPTRKTTQLKHTHRHPNLRPKRNDPRPKTKALESDTRVLAFEAGRKHGVRVNTISAGPLGSRAAKAIGFIDDMIRYSYANAPVQKELAAQEVRGGAGGSASVPSLASFCAAGDCVGGGGKSLHCRLFACTCSKPHEQTKRHSYAIIHNKRTTNAP